MFNLKPKTLGTFIKHLIIHIVYICVYHVFIYLFIMTMFNLTPKTLGTFIKHSIIQQVYVD